LSLQKISPKIDRPVEDGLERADVFVGCANSAARGEAICDETLSVPRFDLMLEIAEWQEIMSDLLEDFSRRYDWQWQARINGRSGGYVVLYRGGIKPSGYKSYCTHCGQKNYQAVPEGQIGICGRCDAEARVNFKQTHMQIFTWPGKDVDMHEDFDDWSLSELRERVELVQEFDRLCETIVEEYFYICRNYRITEEEILVPKTIKILEPVG
jgi:hypothetical protein